MSQAQTRHLGKEEKEKEGIRRLEHARSKARQGPGQEGRHTVRNKARLKSELPASETQSSRRHLDHFNRLSEDQLDYLGFSN